MKQHGLITQRLYNPNPKDNKLPFSDQLKNSDREYLYKYVVDPKHNIRFAAANIKNIINFLNKKRVDAQNNPDIVATFYSRTLKNDSELKPSKRGRQIVNEFYGYAKKWLK